MRYLSLLRGINVAGQKKIKMEDLKALYEGLGFTNVQIYIQSGNVVFDADDSLNHQEVIQAAISQQYGFDVPVLIRRQEDVDVIIGNYPFGTVDVTKEGSQVLVSLLSKMPEPDDVHALKPFQHASESFVVIDQVAYIKCPNGYGKTKLTNTLLEKKLDCTSTTRNWKSLLQLQMMLEEWYE
ncbi:MAG TPA: DUF1697 domain-containing protein [Mariprofundaceae bacterium]|nr:DUF1697 domain-containing protein [Mariprofundaceae bacterium]